MRISTDPKEIKRRLKAWETYLAGVPSRISSLAQAAQAAPKPAPERHSVDVAVVGCGAAGAAAALEAAECGAGASVLICDLFEGGGSTRRSGGVCYAGGGTRVQARHGVEDSPAAMSAYLKRECDGAVADSVVDDFCARSAENFQWLEDCGVDFSGRLYDTKSSYPPSDVSLYLSGSERAYPNPMFAAPAPRGHRPLGDWLTGNVLWAGLESRLDRQENVAMKRHVRCERLLTENGTVIGVAGRVLPESAFALHTMLGEIAAMSSPLGSVMAGSGGPPLWQRCVEQEAILWAELGNEFEVLTSRGVVLAAGGFGFNATMVEKYCPKYLGLCPLGNLGDQGSGIEMGLKIGAGVGQLDRCSAWKFINPPSAFAKGILLDPDGKRIRNEDCYGASLADVYVQRCGGRAWLLIDQSLFDEALASIPTMGPDQSGVALGNLFKNREQAETLDQLAEACGMNAGELASSTETYNAGARRREDAMGKAPDYLAELCTPPFTAINMDVRSPWWPTPMMTLGGLRVDGATGQVLGEMEGGGMPGLYAAGRSAVGVCSNSYVSGLSIADCLYSGRRAGRAVSSVAPRGRL